MQMRAKTRVQEWSAPGHRGEEARRLNNTRRATSAKLPTRLDRSYSPPGVDRLAAIPLPP